MYDLLAVLGNTDDMRHDARRVNTKPLQRLVLGFFAVLIPCSGLALTGDIRHDPAEIVKKYTRLDFKGVRLESASQEVLHPFIEWREEPLWGTVVVVESYEVLDQIKYWEIISPMEARIPVQYKVLGTMYWETATFLAEPSVEQIPFRVKGKLHRWRLMGPHIPPHVSLKRMIRFVRQAILEEGNPSRREQLSALRQELEKAGEHGR